MKSNLRRRMKQQRDTLRYEEIFRYEEAILQRLRELELGQHLFLYADMRKEVPTTRLREWLWSKGKDVYLSLSDFQKTTMQLYHVSEFTPLVKNSWGIEEPYSNTPPLKDPGIIDTVFIPGLAFSREGQRLGYGKGFYDRFLAQVPQARRIGLAYDFQVQDTIPHEPWDEVLDLIVTEKNLYEIPRHPK